MRVQMGILIRSLDHMYGSGTNAAQIESCRANKAKYMFNVSYHHTFPDMYPAAALPAWPY